MVTRMPPPGPAIHLPSRHLPLPSLPTSARKWCARYRSTTSPTSASAAAGCKRMRLPWCARAPTRAAATRCTARAGHRTAQGWFQPGEGSATPASAARGGRHTLEVRVHLWWGKTPGGHACHHGVEHGRVQRPCPGRCGGLLLRPCPAALQASGPEAAWPTRRDATATARRRRRIHAAPGANCARLRGALCSRRRSQGKRRLFPHGSSRTALPARLFPYGGRSMRGGEGRVTPDPIRSDLIHLDPIGSASFAPDPVRSHQTLAAVRRRRPLSPGLGRRCAFSPRRPPGFGAGSPASSPARPAAAPAAAGAAEPGRPPGGSRRKAGNGQLWLECTPCVNGEEGAGEAWEAGRELVGFSQAAFTTPL